MTTGTGGRVMAPRPTQLDPAIKAFCDRVILPTLIERFRAEQLSTSTAGGASATAVSSTLSVRA